MQAGPCLQHSAALAEVLVVPPGSLHLVVSPCLARAAKVGKHRNKTSQRNLCTAVNLGASVPFGRGCKEDSFDRTAFAKSLEPPSGLMTSMPCAPRVPRSTHALCHPKWSHRKALRKRRTRPGAVSERAKAPGHASPEEIIDGEHVRARTLQRSSCGSRVLGQRAGHLPAGRILTGIIGSRWPG